MAAIERHAASRVLDAAGQPIFYSHHVRRGAAAAGLARLRESRGSVGLRALGGQGAAHRSRMASRRVRHAQRRRARVSRGATNLRRRAWAISISSIGIPLQWRPFRRGAARLEWPTWWAMDGSGRARVFAPFEGFEAFSFYPGYSANFFDSEHYVMKGGSARTAACMLAAVVSQLVSAALPVHLRGFPLRRALTRISSASRSAYAHSSASAIFRLRIRRGGASGFNESRARKRSPRSISTRSGLRALRSDYAAARVWPVPRR